MASKYLAHTLCNYHIDQDLQTFTALPDAQKITFQSVPAANLSTLLPNLPQGPSLPYEGSHFPPSAMVASPLDLIQRFLVYPPDRRLKAFDALQHPWFSQGTLILPEGYSLASSSINPALTIRSNGLSSLLAKHFTS